MKTPILAGAVLIVVLGLVLSQVRIAMTEPTAYDADINHDGVVGFSDFVVLLQHWNASAPLPTPTPEPCTQGILNMRWAAGNGHCYSSFPTPLNWRQAKADCEWRAGYLVTLTDAAENQFVYSNLGDPGVLIGLTDEAAEGIWLWVTGEPAAYTNWHAGEPNNGSGGPYEHAASFHGAHDDGTWNDIQIDSGGGPGYICEFEN